MSGTRWRPYRFMMATGVAVLWISALAVKILLRPALQGSTPSVVVTLLGSAPSLVGGVTVPLCFLIAHPSPNRSAVLMAAVWGVGILTIAEILELALRHSTFDWMDLAASVVGAAFSIVVCLALLPLETVTRSR